MRVETLPSPGLLSNGIRIRIEAAKAISAVEIAAAYGAGKTSTANSLKAFFDACSAAVAGFTDVVVPTLAGAFIDALYPNMVRLVFTEGLDELSVPAASAFTTTGQIKTANSIVIEGNVITLGFATDFVAGAANIVYTKPGVDPVVQDTSGNDLASIVATPITNGIV